MFSPLRRRVEALRDRHGTLFAGRQGGILLTVAFGWLLVLGVRLVIPALLPRISTEFDLGYTVGGSVFSLLLAVAALMQFPGGVLTDRLGGRSVLFAGVAVAALGVLLMAVAPLFLAFVVGVVLFGLGTGLYGTPRVTVLSAIYPDRDGTAIGITSAAGNIGTSVLPVVAGTLAVAYGWRQGFAFALPLFVVTAVSLWLILPTGRESNEPEETPFRENGACVLTDSSRQCSRAVVCSRSSCRGHVGSARWPFSRYS